MTKAAQWDIQFDVQVDPQSIATKPLRKAAEAVFEQHTVGAARVTVTIVGDAQMQACHEQYLHETSTTDVMSFDLTDEFENTPVFDLIVNAEMAQRQAAQRGHRAEAELALYVIHGLLHNLGYDDSSPRQAERMHRTEDAVLNALGFGAVYYGKEQKTQDQEQSTETDDG